MVWFGLTFWGSKQSFIHARQVLYHWATFQPLSYFMSHNFCWILGILYKLLQQFRVPISHLGIVIVICLVPTVTMNWHSVVLEALSCFPSMTHSAVKLHSLSAVYCVGSAILQSNLTPLKESGFWSWWFGLPQSSWVSLVCFQSRLYIIKSTNLPPAALHHNLHCSWEHPHLNVSMFCYKWN